MLCTFVINLKNAIAFMLLFIVLCFMLKSIEIDLI